jgi:ethanolamine utilization protein EutQ
MDIQHFTTAQVETWYQPGDSPIYLGDVVDATNSDSMSVGFAQYAKGSSNAWVVTYDEVLIITKGVFGVRSDKSDQVASAGEVLFLKKGTSLTYYASEDTQLVYVSFPHWADAQSSSEYAHLLDAFQPVVHPE